MRRMRPARAGDLALRSPSGWVALNSIAAESPKAEHRLHHPEHAGDVE
jgi:hypothetical protein